MKGQRICMQCGSARQQTRFDALQKTQVLTTVILVFFNLQLSLLDNVRFPLAFRALCLAFSRDSTSIGYALLISISVCPGCPLGLVVAEDRSVQPAGAPSGRPEC